MKKAVTAAAICSVAAAATSLPSTCRLPASFLTPSLRTRGGEAADSTSVPNTATSSTYAGAATGTTAPKKKRKKKKPVAFDTPDGTEEDQTSSQQEQPSTPSPTSPSPDPLLEDLLHEDDFYAVLGIEKAATESQIKKAYRKRAVLTHPDKTGGDRRAFDKVSQAYEVLGDDAKRQVYNRFGKRGLEQGGGAAATSGGNSPEDLFRHFFGQQSKQTAPRNRTVRYQLEVSLEDLYEGMERSILVEQPYGRKKVQVHIPKGTTSGESITLSGEMDGVPNDKPGDLIFLLQQQPHAIFTRKGHDLAIEVLISFEEAIGGVDRELKHLDGRKLHLQSARRSEDLPVWIQTGDVQVLKGEGMPKRDSTSEFGDLYVHFRVDLPNSSTAGRLSVEERGLLRDLLRKMDGKKSIKSSTNIGCDAEEIRSLQTGKLSDFGSASGTFRPQEEPEEPRQQRGPGVYWSNNSRSNPFFGGASTGNDDGSNVQCQQM
mmetsp:Transcript_29609/g.48856  ORF Transcript_29609/g.48856 Transcript_29609/m.48856 type:complete len:486 (-) Transcript_29609:51-1508(-)